MSSKSYHKPISAFWALGVPAIVFAVIYYAYRSPGWVGSQIQGALGPIIDPLIRWVDRIV